MKTYSRWQRFLVRVNGQPGDGLSRPVGEKMKQHCIIFGCEAEATHHIAVQPRMGKPGQWVKEQPYCLKHTQYAVYHLSQDIVSYHPIANKLQEAVQ